MNRSSYDNLANEYRLGEVNAHLGYAFLHAGTGRRAQNRMHYHVSRAKERALEHRQMQKELARRDRSNAYEQYMRDTTATNFAAGRTCQTFNPAAVTAIPANSAAPRSTDTQSFTDAIKIFNSFMDGPQSTRPLKNDYMQFIESLEHASIEMGAERTLDKIMPLIDIAKAADQSGFVMILEQIAEQQVQRLEEEPQHTYAPLTPHTPVQSFPFRMAA